MRFPRLGEIGPAEQFMEASLDAGSPRAVVELLPQTVALNGFIAFACIWVSHGHGLGATPSGTVLFLELAFAFHILSNSSRVGHALWLMVFLAVAALESAIAGHYSAQEFGASALRLVVTSIGAGLFKLLRGPQNPIADQKALLQFSIFALMLAVAFGLSSAIVRNILQQSDILAPSPIFIELEVSASSFLSMVVGVPFFAALPWHSLRNLREKPGAETAIVAGFVLALLCAGIAVQQPAFRNVIWLLLFPALIWAAVRLNALAATFLYVFSAAFEFHAAARGNGMMPLPANYAEYSIVWTEAIYAARSLALLTITAYSMKTTNMAAALESGIQKLNSVIETAKDGIITINDQGIMQTFSKAAEKHFGYTAGEVIGRNVKMLMPDYHADHHDGYMTHYMETGEKRIIGIGRIVNGLRKDGTVFPMELAVGEARLGDKRIFTGFVRDISERQETEQRLHELQDELFRVSRVSAMGELASSIAHELNQPLAAIKNYAQAGKLMLGKDKSKQEVEAVFRKVDEQAGRAGEVIKRLRTFISGKKIESAPADIHQIIGEACALALIGAKEDGVRTTTARDRAIPSVMVDRIQIQQVLINLIRNAVDAMHDADRRDLTIESKLHGGEVHIRVIDTGPGVSASVAEQLFKPFVSTKPGGMGIGLSISRAIAEAHGGKLTYAPNAEGGSVFTLTLPVAQKGGGLA